MEAPVGAEEAGWIIEEAAKRGLQISRRQLAEWHRDGLLPEPVKHGLGRGAGSQSHYPAGTLKQAIEISNLIFEYRKIDRVGWELWLRRYTVDQQYWLPRFQRIYNLLSWGRGLNFESYNIYDNVSLNVIQRFKRVINFKAEKSLNNLMDTIFAILDGGFEVNGLGERDLIDYRKDIDNTLRLSNGSKKKISIPPAFFDQQPNRIFLEKFQYISSHVKTYGLIAPSASDDELLRSSIKEILLILLYGEKEIVNDASTKQARHKFESLYLNYCSFLNIEQVSYLAYFLAMLKRDSVFLSICQERISEIRAAVFHHREINGIGNDIQLRWRNFLIE